MKKLNELTRKVTAFASWTELCLAGSRGYSPTLTGRNPEETKLANEFDRAMAGSDCKARAWRGSN